MSQYITGTVTTTNGSATVTGVGTSWLTEVDANDLFIIQGESVIYFVAGVTNDTTLTLSAPYAGVTGSSRLYVLHRDFFPNGLPTLANGDLESAAIYNLMAAQATLTVDLGTAATHDVTTGPTDVTAESLLRVDDAYAVNSLNYHRANTNFNVFGADAVGDLILLGEARTAVQARLYGNTSSPTAPISITVSGTFSLVTPSGTTLKTGIASSDMILSSDSTGKLFNIAVLNLVGATVKDTYELRAELSTSKITVNF